MGGRRENILSNVFFNRFFQLFVSDFPFSPSFNNFCTLFPPFPFYFLSLINSMLPNKRPKKVEHWMEIEWTQIVPNSLNQKVPNHSIQFQFNNSFCQLPAVNNVKCEEGWMNGWFEWMNGFWLCSTDAIHSRFPFTTSPSSTFPKFHFTHSINHFGPSSPKGENFSTIN